jgi:pimeloyl-ACP methyl ester carboxylesterase
MTSRRKKAMALPADDRPRIRRAYMECRFGQLHVSTAFPVGGGFNEHPTLIALHRCPLSSRFFRPFMEEVGRDRSVYAPDLPGYGESDPPPPDPGIEDYAGAVADFLDHMRFRQVDVLGHDTGSLIAVQLALERTAIVRRLVLVGVPILDDDEREPWVRTFTPLAEEAARRFDDTEDFRWMANAALNYPVTERLPRISQTSLLVRAKGPLWDATLRAKPALRNAKVVELADSGDTAFRAASKVLATHLRSFLDRGT